MIGMPDNNLTEIFRKTHERLSKGTQPGAYAELKKSESRRLANVEEELAANFTEEGIMIYQRKMIKGFKLCNLWRTT